MTCPKCGGTLDERKMICKYCVEAMNEEALRRRQHAPLLLVAAGKGEFVLHPTNTGLHAGMFGYRVKRAFCGSVKRAAEKNRRRASYRGRAWPTVCEKCREAIEELLADAQEAEAIQQEAKSHA